MQRNRIQRFERLWTDAAVQSGPVPDGFVAYSTAAMTAEQQLAVVAGGKLYQWAYDRARQAVDERFVNDWII